MNRAAPREEHRALSLIMAVLMHGLIAALLYFGVQWHTQKAAPMEVELWAGALQPAPPPPVVQKSVAKPTPAPKVEAPPEPPPPVKPDIAEERPKPAKPKPEKKPEPVKKPEPKPEPKKPEPPKKAEPEKAKPQPKAEIGKGKLASDKFGKLDKPPLDPTASLNALAARARAAEANANAKEFEAYLALVRNQVRRNMNYVGEPSGNPEVIFEVKLLPDRSVLEDGLRLVKPSGVPAFDEAVRRAILRLGQYPAPPAGVDISTLRRHQLKYRLNE